MDLICNSLTPMSAQEQRRANKDMIRSSTDLTARLVCAFRVIRRGLIDNG